MCVVGKGEKQTLYKTFSLHKVSAGSKNYDFRGIK